MKIIIFIILLVILYFILCQNKPIESYDEEHSSEVDNELYELMTLFNTICTDHNIEYFIILDVLYGAVKLHNFIPNDYDIDVGIMEDQLSKLNGIDFKSYGLIAENIMSGEGKIYKKGNSKWIDVFAYTKQPSSEPNKIDLAYMPSRKANPNEFFYSNELYPIKYNYRINNLILPGPNNPMPYLKRKFKN